jgi:hypothetical protein
MVYFYDLGRTYGNQPHVDLRRWMCIPNKRSGIKSIGTTLGAGMGVSLVSFGCCSLPIFYPFLLLFLSSAAADTLIYQLMDESSVMFNIIQIVILMLMTYLTIRILERNNT